MQKKLFLYFSIIFIVGMLITTIFSYSVVKKEINQSTTDKLVSEVELIADVLKLRTELNIKGFDAAFTKRLREITNSRITIIRNDGVVIYDSVANISTMDNHLKRAEVVSALAGEVGISKRRSSTVGQEFLYVAKAVEDNNKIISIIRLSVELKDVKSIVSKMESEIFFSFLIGLLISLVMGFLASYFITTPIKQLTLAADKIAAGNFSERLVYSGNDEIYKLTSSFNEMSFKLGEILGELGEKNSNLQAILDNVVNGIIAVDNDDKVLFANKAAEKYLGVSIPEYKGLHIMQSFREKQLDDFLKIIKKENDLYMEEMNLGRKKDSSFLVYGSPIRSEKDGTNYGNIIVIHDISSLKKLEKVRSEFVANVSHELKTPLTSIKGFAETLQGGGISDQVTADNFLGIIYEEAERLERLIEDILALSEIESKKFNDLNERFNIKDTIDEVMIILESQYRQKKLDIKFSIEDEQCELNVDRNRFKQMVLNILENAMKYTPEKGVIEISVSRMTGGISLSVSDNGMGIPKESLDRIFERFYRVDKARSREIGGTGLGLSIVKHIVQSMNGEIHVESEIDKGSKFTIFIPE